MSDTPEEIARDVASVGRIEAVPTLLRVLCEMTGMGFAAVARVTDGTWTACAVRDEIHFGLQPGGQLDVNTTLCKEVRQARVPVVIEQASTDADYRDHHTPRLYSIESYVSVPIVLSSGAYFGNLCAIDPRPAKVREPRVVAMFQHFAELVARQLENEQRREIVQTALLDERATGELRDQLMAILGHDLRNTIGALAMSCQSLKARASQPAAVATLADAIGAGASRATQLIDDALEFARGRLGGSLAVEPRWVERIDEALFGVVSGAQRAHPGREVEWRFEVDQPVWVDRGRLQQVATNLLDNALTHGSPVGTARLTASTHDGGLTLEVWNDGPPIAPADLEKVFEPFWRGAGAGRGEGLGLGLFICARIVEAHGGTLRATSSAHDGTRFVVTLPPRER